METSVNKHEEGEKIIRNHILGAMGIGLIPVPLIDLIAISGIQLNMLRKLANLYCIPFSKDKVKHILASLLGGVFSVSVSGTLASIVKTIPLVGQTTGVLTMPVTAGAMVYAVGKVFIQHFESGGTLLNLNPDDVKVYYERMFKEGEKLARDLQETKKNNVEIEEVR